MLSCELQLITGKYQKRGRINIESFLETFESNIDISKNNANSTTLLKENENFGKTLHKKICKLRSNDISRADFRKSVILEDPDMVGHIHRKKLQKILDSKLDLTESECGLLMENLLFPDGTHRDSVEYSLLLLLLCEPLKRNVATIAAGAATVNKMMRGADSSTLKKLLRALFRSFSSADPRALGVIPSITAENILRNECRAVDVKHLNVILESFQDDKSDCVQYIELVSFLSNSSITSVFDRIRSIDKKRQKQGYNFCEYLQKYVSRKGKKIDSARLNEQMLAIGILLPETGMSTIFSQYGGRGAQKGSLDVGDFIHAMENADDDGVGARAEKLDIKPYRCTYLKLNSPLSSVAACLDSASLDATQSSFLSTQCE